MNLRCIVYRCYSNNGGDIMGIFWFTPFSTSNKAGLTGHQYFNVNLHCMFLLSCHDG
jgi:hypothetical protein